MTNTNNIFPKILQIFFFFFLHLVFPFSSLIFHHTCLQYWKSELKCCPYIIVSVDWGQKKNFCFYSQAICCHRCWRCRNNTGVRAKNKTAVYLPLLELQKWYAQWSGAAVCFPDIFIPPSILFSCSILLGVRLLIRYFASAAFRDSFGVAVHRLGVHCAPPHAARSFVLPRSGTLKETNCW